MAANEKNSFDQKLQGSEKKLSVTSEFLQELFDANPKIQAEITKDQDNSPDTNVNFQATINEKIIKSKPNLDIQDPKYQYKRFLSPPTTESHSASSVSSHPQLKRSKRIAKSHTKEQIGSKGKEQSEKKIILSEPQTPSPPPGITTGALNKILGGLMGSSSPRGGFSLSHNSKSFDLPPSSNNIHSSLDSTSTSIPTKDIIQDNNNNNHEEIKLINHSPSVQNYELRLAEGIEDFDSAESKRALEQHHAVNVPAHGRRRINYLQRNRNIAFALPPQAHTPSIDYSKASPSLSSDSNIPPKLFVQMDEYSLEEGLTGGHHYWREIARWIKYQEDLEESSSRWGKPHVPILSFHGLAELRKRLETGTVMLDLYAKDYNDVILKVCKELREDGHLDSLEHFNAMLNCLSKPHKQHHKKISIMSNSKASYKILSKISLTKATGSSTNNKPSPPPCSNGEFIGNSAANQLQQSRQLTTTTNDNPKKGGSGDNNNRYGISNQSFVNEEITKLSIPTTTTQGKFRRMNRTPKRLVQLDGDRENMVPGVIPNNTIENSHDNNNNNYEEFDDIMKEGVVITNPSGLMGRVKETASNLSSKIPKFISDSKATVGQLQTKKKADKDKMELLKNNQQNGNTNLTNGSIAFRQQQQSSGITVNPTTTKQMPQRKPSIFGQINNAFSQIAEDGTTTAYGDREGVLVMIGSALFLSTEITVFARLKNSFVFPAGIMEDSRIQVRFVVIIMGPGAGGPPQSAVPLPQDIADTTGIDLRQTPPSTLETALPTPPEPSLRVGEVTSTLGIESEAATSRFDPAANRHGEVKYNPTALSAPSYDLPPPPTPMKSHSFKKLVDTDYRELGRSFSALMSNEDFNVIAYRASTCQELTSAFNVFLKNAIVLPPGEFGRSTLMPITNLYKEQLMKKKLQKDQLEWGRNKGLDKKPLQRKLGAESSQEQIVTEVDVLTPKKFGSFKDFSSGDKWNCRVPFGGLISDVKRKIPFYLNDFTNAFKLQCISTFVFIYFACLSPCITFGGILGTKTDNWIGVSETMIATSLGGCLFALLSGQPLTIIGPTGPMLIFEDSLYKFSLQNRINYLAFRFWVALWVFVITLIFLAIQGGYLIRYLTRFIQEIFSILISFIFIYETFFNLYMVFKLHPLLPDYCHLNFTLGPNFQSNIESQQFLTYFFPISTLSALRHNGIGTHSTTPLINPATGTSSDSQTFGNLEKFKVYPSYPNGTISNSFVYEIPYYALRFPTDYSLSHDTGEHLKFEKYVSRFHIIRPNTALFVMLLMFGTFFVAYFLKVFRNSKYFGRGARRILADFGVPIAILSMVIFAYLVGKNVYIPKLNVPSSLTPTSPDKRNWLVNPFTGSKPSYLPRAPHVLSRGENFTALIEKNATSLDNNVAAVPAAPDFFYKPIHVSQIFLAIIPALMIFILLFLEGMITSLIVNRKDRKFIKGPAYNLDLLILGTCPLILSIFGLPFISGATVRSLAHVSSLTVFSRTHAPGEPSAIIGVLEQRVTAFSVALCIGVSMFFSKFLQKVPVAVLFGIFLYLGISSLKGIQFFDRILLMLMPLKHYPTLNYVRNIGLLKLHLYTLIQLSCLVALWAVRLTPAAQAFPFVLIIYIFIRFQLHWIYTPRELYELDKDDEGSDSDDDMDLTEEVHMPI